jgi:SAM-dependent methyltransferase
MFLPRSYFSEPGTNRLNAAGDLAAARAHFVEHRPRNLVRLLEQRYDWMNSYIADDAAVVEIGAGPGLVPFFVRADNLVLSDVIKHPWVDIEADALDLPFETGSYDAVICSNVIHHVARPVPFMRDLHRVLKPGGVVLIQENYTSWMMRLLLYTLRYEGWSYDVDVFDESAVVNDPDDPWSANCAVSRLLFDDRARFEAAVPGFIIERDVITEFLLAFLSGGTTATWSVPQLPGSLLTLVQGIDRALVALAPRFFAFGRSVALRKV